MNLTNNTSTIFVEKSSFLPPILNNRNILSSSMNYYNSCSFEQLSIYLLILLILYQQFFYGYRLKKL